jgi:hypothetical protein
MRILNDEVLLRPGAHPAVLGVALSEPMDSGAPQVLLEIHWHSLSDLIRSAGDTGAGRRFISLPGDGRDAGTLVARRVTPRLR